MSTERAPSATAARQQARLERREAALAARASMSPTEPAPTRLRVATWNVNSLKPRLPALERFIDRAEPDVVCLQETKSSTVSAAADEALTKRGYHHAHVGDGSYNGVTIIALSSDVGVLRSAYASAAKRLHQS